MNFDGVKSLTLTFFLIFLGINGCEKMSKLKI